MLNTKIKQLSSILIYVFIAVFYCYFAYKHFYSILCGIPGPLDHINHANSGIHLIGELRNGKNGLNSFLHTDPYPHIVLYPVWHIMVFIPYHFLNGLLESNIALSFSMALVDCFFTIPSLMIIYRILAKQLSFVPSALLFLLSIALLLVGPLDGSCVYDSYYLGAYTANPWHNPTYLAVRPFALLTLDSYIELLSDMNHTAGDYVKCAMLLAFSAFLKPSFYQVFLPALVVYCLICFLKNPNKNLLGLYSRVALTCIPIGVIALFQLFALPSSGQGSGIGIGFLYVWKAFTSNWILSLLCSIAFPLLCYIVLITTRRWNTALSIVSLVFLSAIIQYMFLYIKAGPFAADFSWGFDLAIGFTFIYGLRESLYQIHLIKEARCRFTILFICGLLFMTHLYFGIRYFYSVFVLNQFGGPLPHLFQ